MVQLKELERAIDSAKKIINEFRPFSHNEVVEILKNKEVFARRHADTENGL